MLPEKNTAAVIRPFVFRIEPGLYPAMAAWYADEPDLLKKLGKAFDSLGPSSKNLEKSHPEDALFKPIRKHVEAYLDLSRPGWKDQGEPEIAPALDELLSYARFFQEVKAQIGCAGQPLDDRSRRDLCTLLEEYGALIRPEAVVGRYGCVFEGEKVGIEGMKVSITSRSLRRFFTTPLKRGEEEEYAHYESERPEHPPPGECLLFAATIGPGIDREVAALSTKGETYRALLLNGIGAGAADMVGMDLERWTNHWAPAPGARWRRFHIGYGDFKLEAQRLLFSLLDPGRIGLVLNESCMMIPEKSVSGFMAVKREGR